MTVKERGRDVQFFQSVAAAVLKKTINSNETRKPRCLLLERLPVLLECLLVSRFHLLERHRSGIDRIVCRHAFRNLSNHTWQRTFIIHGMGPGRRRLYAPLGSIPLLDGQLDSKSHKIASSFLSCGRRGVEIIFAVIFSGKAPPSVS
jgi:hypothetical protein